MPRTRRRTQRVQRTQRTRKGRKSVRRNRKITRTRGNRAKRSRRRRKVGGAVYEIRRKSTLGNRTRYLVVDSKNYLPVLRIYEKPDRMKLLTSLTLDHSSSYNYNNEKLMFTNVIVSKEEQDKLEHRKNYEIKIDLVNYYMLNREIIQVQNAGKAKHLAEQRQISQREEQECRRKIEAEQEEVEPDPFRTGASLHNLSDPPPPDPPSPPPPPPYGATTTANLSELRSETVPPDIRDLQRRYRVKEIFKYLRWMEQSKGDYAQALASLPLRVIKVRAKNIGVDVPDTPESTSEEEYAKKQELLRLIGEKRIQNFEEWASTVSGPAPEPAPASGTT